MSLKDERELEQIEAGVSFDAEKGRWIANYPWVRRPEGLPDNRKIAVQMMLPTEIRKCQRMAKEVYERQRYKFDRSFE